MRILETFSDIGKILKPGTVLWRNSGISSIHHPRVMIHDVPFAKTDRGSYMARLSFVSSSWSYEPTVWFTENHRAKLHGLVLFVDKLLPDDWLCLILTGVSKSGNAAFAKYPGTPDVKQFKAFLLKSYYFMSENLNAPAEEKLALAKQAFEECPIDVVEGHHRLAVVGKWERATEDAPGGYIPAIEYLS